jgi:hypothetical protein
VDVEMESHHGKQSGHFTGAALVDILKDAGVTDAPAKGSHLTHVLIVHGGDGYTVAVAMGEIDPEFEGKQVIVAYSKDGQPDNPRLIVPGDHKAGRSVHDVVEIEVK